MTKKAERAARIFADLRAQGAATDSLPADISPASLAEAYAIQDMTGRAEGVHGWKVGPAKPGETEPRCAILLGPAPLSSPARIAAAALPRGMVELEIGFTFARDVAPDADRQAVISAIGTAHLALEILNPRFAKGAAIGDFDGVADHQSNFGIVVGAGRSDWSGLTLETLDMSLTLDGEARQASTAMLGLEPTLGLVVWLAAHARSRGFPFRAGTVVITGARLGPFDLAGLRRIEGSAQGFAPVSLELIS